MKISSFSILGIFHEYLVYNCPHLWRNMRKGYPTFCLRLHRSHMLIRCCMLCNYWWINILTISSHVLILVGNLENYSMAWQPRIHGNKHIWYVWLYMNSMDKAPNSLKWSWGSNVLKYLSYLGNLTPLEKRGMSKILSKENGKMLSKV